MFHDFIKIINSSSDEDCAMCIEMKLNCTYHWEIDAINWFYPFCSLKISNVCIEHDSHDKPSKQFKYINYLY